VLPRQPANAQHPRDEAADGEGIVEELWRSTMTIRCKN
jgi:hypothetical protein